MRTPASNGTYALRHLSRSCIAPASPRCFQPGQPAEQLHAVEHTQAAAAFSGAVDPWASDNDEDEVEDLQGEHMDPDQKRELEQREMATRRLISYGGARGAVVAGAYLPDVEKGDTVLMLAMRAGDKELVRMLLRELKPDANVRNSARPTPQTAFEVAEVSQDLAV
jgi:hypothetical protein